MSRFNKTTEPQKTVNKAGGEAYVQSDKMEFVSLLLTSFLADKAYRTGSEEMKRVAELATSVDPLFAAKAAVYARREFGMRSVSHVVAGELAATVKGQDWTKRFFEKIVRRPDDMLEILSYYRSKGLKNEPKALRRGFASALGKMDAYKLAKYRGENKDISMVDLVNMVHPKSTEALTALMNGTLPSAETWESKMSKAGKTAKTEDEKDELKNAVWSELLAENKLGYFALLRNLRNIANDAPDALDLALKQLVDRKAIRGSLVLPFRFYTAYKQFEHEGGASGRKIRSAISKALDISVENMPDFGERVLVVVDHSGSMDTKMSDNSDSSYFEIGALFGVALAKKSNADLMYFGDTAKYYNVTEDSVSSQIDKLQSLNQGWSNGAGFVGHGTNFRATLEEANQAYDRIFYFSDMQGWIGYYTPTAELARYQKRFDVTPKIFSFDLAGYGSLQFPEGNVFAIAGFSDKSLDVLQKLDTDKNALVKEIEGVQI